MGQEIEESRFTPEDFVEYAKCLRRETELLGQWFRDGLFSARDRMGGFELEAWLVDDAVRPAPVNDTFLKRLDNPMVVPELARFNVELNDHPQHLWGSALSRFEASLGSTWNQCRKTAADLQTQLLMIGIMGEYLARIFDEVKRRPLYLIGEHTDGEESVIPPERPVA